MNRKQFKAFLDRCVQEGFIDQDQARQFMTDFRAGRISQADLPLTPDKGITDISRSDLEEAAAALAKEGINIDI